MRALFDALLGFCILLAGTALVTMMAVFMGNQHPVLGTVLRVQLAASALAAGVFAVGALLMWRQWGSATAREFWRRLPGWLVFAFALLTLLVALGELSYYLIYRVAGRTIALEEHAPLLALLASSLAYCVVYAVSAGHDAGESRK